MIFLLQHGFLLAIDLLLAMTLSCFFYAFACISIAFLTCFVIIFSFGTVERNVDVKGRAVVILMSNSSIGRMFARNLDKAGFKVSAAHWPAREKGTATEECTSNMEVAQLHMNEDEYQKTVKTFVESHLSLKGPTEEGHFGSQSMHHEASPTADTYREAVGNPSQYLLLPAAIQHPVAQVLTLLFSSEASSRPAVPVIRSCATLHGPGYIPPHHRQPAGSGKGSLHTSSVYGMMKNPSILIWEEGASDTRESPERKTSCDQKKSLKAPCRNYLLQPVLCVGVLFRPLNCALSFLKRSPRLLMSLLKSKN